MTKRVGLIGFGAIGRSIVEAWQRSPVDGFELAALLVRPRQVEEAAALVSTLPGVFADLESFLTSKPDIVVEAAGQSAVRDCGEAVVRRGAELFVISTGALADDALRQRLVAACHAAGGRIAIPVGATAGLDGLLAMRRQGLSRVRYTSSKPPVAWKGTPAETLVDLDRLSEPTTFFEGSAREAARSYPKNANLAATVALAGLGFERTEVRLVADPGASGNTGTIEAESETSRLAVAVAGRSSAGNPKTSAITGMSVLAAVENRSAAIRFV